MADSTVLPPKELFKSIDIDVKKFTMANLEKMKETFPMETNDTVARFLIARKNNVEQAIDQLRRTIAWKSTTYPVLKSSCYNELKTGKVYVHGTDKDGRPLLIWRASRNSIKERSVEELSRAAFWSIEQAIKQLPDDKSRFTILADRTGVSLEHADTEMAKYMAPMLQTYYPERVEKMIVYPAGPVYYAIFQIVKVFIDPDTARKAAPCMFLSGVKDLIDPKYIPKAMGGDSDFEFSPDLVDDPYSPEELQEYISAAAAASASAAASSITTTTTTTTSVGNTVGTTTTTTTTAAGSTPQSTTTAAAITVNAETTPAVAADVSSS